jgi:hypothetical protein
VTSSREDFHLLVNAHAGHTANGSRECAPDDKLRDIRERMRRQPRISRSLIRATGLDRPVKPDDDSGESAAFVPNKLLLIQFQTANFRHTSTLPRRKAPELCMILSPKRAWGMPGARCTRSLAWE